MRVNRITALILSIFIICSLVACSSDIENPEGKPIAVSIVLGRHANAKAFSDEYYKKAQEIVEKAVYGGFVSVVINDGEPRRLELKNKNGKAISFEQDANNETIRSKRVLQRSEDIMNFIKDDINRATVPENNLLGAIKEARASLNSANAAGVADKRIIIMDTGITTAGDFKFQDLAFKSAKKTPSITSIVKELQKNKGILPDLSEIKVQFIGLGDVAAPQAMNDSDKVFVKDLWKAIFRACGADVDDNSILIAGIGDASGINSGDTPNESPKDGNEGGVFPYVTPIYFSPLILNFGDSTDSDTFTESDGIPTDTVGFKPDSSEFLNADSATYILKPYAEGIQNFLEQNPDEKIYLVGSVAISSEGDFENPKDFVLSNNRAEKVKSTLVENYNLPNERLVTIGLGGMVPWRINEFKNGKFIEDIAKKNRAVWILKESSEKYKQIPEKYKQ